MRTVFVAVGTNAGDQLSGLNQLASPAWPVQIEPARSAGVEINPDASHSSTKSFPARGLIGLTLKRSSQTGSVFIFRAFPFCLRRLWFIRLKLNMSYPTRC